MITKNGATDAIATDNLTPFADVIALFQLSSQSGGGGSPPPTTTTVTTTMMTSTKTAAPPPPTSTGWNFRGCYTDNVSGRALIGEPVPGGAGAMTVEACENVCQGLGYILAGVEYSGECCKFSVLLTI